MKTTTKQLALDRIRSIFQDQFLDESMQVTEDSSPSTVELWDSMAQVSLLIGIESEFGFQFTAEEMGEIASVADILGALKTRGVIVD